MDNRPTLAPRRPGFAKWLALSAIVIGGVVAVVAITYAVRPAREPRVEPTPFRPRRPVDAGGFAFVLNKMQTWRPGASLADVAQAYDGVAKKHIQLIEAEIASPRMLDIDRVEKLVTLATLHNSERDPKRAYQCLEEAHKLLDGSTGLAHMWRYTLIYFQGVCALRRGENENCIECRGESSCILPIAPAAVHRHDAGSRLAVKHFTDYLQLFPDDLEVRWLLNLAHMTLGEHPGGIDPAYLISLDRFRNSEFDIGRFRDIGHLVGVNTFNQAGGAVMDDFDNDGLLDIVITHWEATEPMVFFRNKGDGTFEDFTARAGLSQQLGGLNLAQGDYNNDGHLDLFITRGAWLNRPIRPSLMHNNGNGTFADVTAEAGLTDPVNSNNASWADFDNDGHLDLYVTCEVQPNRLYRNKGNGTFEEIAKQAGVVGSGKQCKGCAWIDYDNDGYPDLFLNQLLGTAEWFHNNRDGRFSPATKSLGISGPIVGFSCWAWDYDNDGWLDLFATSYDRTVEDVVKGLIGEPHQCNSNKLFRNLQGKGFADVTKEAGLDIVFATMGSNFGDFDNDGYLDMYLGTGDPNLATLVPNRMMKNVAGKRFAEITGTSGTGHLQKGHGVACGDWDRDGNTDIFIETGGAINGDRYHNVLFQNPGQGNHWLAIKLIGKKSNRSAIGARIKLVTAGANPLTVHRHVTGGSSFGGNPLQQQIGLAKADRIAILEIHWPTSGTTQVFRDIAANQAIEVTELETEYRKLDRPKLKVPQ